jgi:hypothetical protein
MVDRAIRARTPSAASPATDEVARDAQDVAMLSRMAALAEELAAGFQVQGVAALKGGDLDRAEKAEGGFSRLFLGIRRAIALTARLSQQREEAQRQAAAGRGRRQEQKDRRRQAVAQRVSRAIAVVKPEAQERLTADLWDRLIENDRIDADLADTALPIETLIRRLGREIGLADSAIAYGLDPDRAKADRAAAAARAWRPAVTPAGDDTDDPDPDEEPITESSYTIGVWAADYGGPERERWVHCVTSGEIFNEDGDLVMTVPIPDEPWKAGGHDTPPPWLRRKAPADPGGGGPPASAGPLDPQPPPLDPEEAEFQRQAAYARQHGITLIMPPAVRERLGLPRHEPADGGSENQGAPDMGS